MKQKGFTLIELLVVVAIIGILAAVGVVAFQGFINNARERAVLSNMQIVIKYIKLEVMKCHAGHTTAMNGHLTCSGRNTNDIVIAAEKALAHIRNTSNPSDRAVWSSGNVSSDSDVGYIRIGTLVDEGKNYVRVETCSKTPCATDTNQLKEDVSVDE